MIQESAYSSTYGVAILLIVIHRLEFKQQFSVAFERRNCMRSFDRELASQGFDSRTEHCARCHGARPAMTPRDEEFLWKLHGRNFYIKALLDKKAPQEAPEKTLGLYPECGSNLEKLAN